MEMSLSINFLLTLQYFALCVMKNRCDEKKQAAAAAAMGKDEEERKNFEEMNTEQ